MELLIIISYVLISIVFFSIGRYYNKKTKPNSSELEYSINNTKFLNELNPLVKDIYLQFINKEGIKYFQEKYCTILISNLDVEFWSENNIYCRRFTKIPEIILKEYNLTVKEINNTLTLADQKVLDTIAKAIIINNKEFISRLFI